mmetsp:Transcript_21340/g.55467  ORF Transcript_21340/g.55467 Transcript_21340/m.55467 type:complete len:214 (-) Transcript_21340:1239-1880(-)
MHSSSPRGIFSSRWHRIHSHVDVSQSLHDLSFEHVASQAPSGEKVQELIPSVCPSRVLFNFPSGNCQIWTLLCLDEQVARRSLLDEKANEVALLECSLSLSGTEQTFVTSQRRHVLSSEQDTSLVPSGENMQLFTALVCLSNTATHFPSDGFQIRLELSAEAVARRVKGRVPSPENVQRNTSSLCPLRTWMQSPVSVLQMRQVWSSDEVARML